MPSRKARKIIFITLLVGCVGLLVNHGYNRLMAEIVSVRAESEIRRDFNPPLFGARHVELRTRFILDQISQQNNESYGLVLGDSIIEGMSLLGITSAPLINGGIGGARVIDVYNLLSKVQLSKQPDFVIVSVGVNDL